MGQVMTHMIGMTGGSPKTGYTYFKRIFSSYLTTGKSDNLVV